MNAIEIENAIALAKVTTLVKVTTKILRKAISVKTHSHNICCQLPLLFIFLMNFSPLYTDSSRVSINNPLALSPDFVLFYFYGPLINLP